MTEQPSIITFASEPTTEFKSLASLNFSVIKRYLTALDEILFIANHAVVYAFDTKSEAWQPHNVEGALFICRLRPSPDEETFAIIVLNRKNLDNFTLDLHPSTHCEMDGELLIVTGPGEELDIDGSRVFGLWIFAESGKTTAGVRTGATAAIMSCLQCL